MRKIAAILLISVSVLLLSAYGLYKLMNARTFQLFGEVVSSLDTNQKTVALTFDDGPNDKADHVLHILKQANIKATFFLIGESIEKYPEEAEKLVQASHEIGNHTYSHQRMIFKSPSFIENEIEKTDQLIREAGYEGEILFRPPYGKKILGLPYYLSKHDRKTIMWDVEPESYPEIAKSPETIVQYVLQHTKPGSIILLHIWHYSKDEQSYIIENVTKGLKEKGYTFQTVSQLLQ
ncbi:polysaccharide deacetylase family protein [Ectobacillus funiculus]|uniref:polysaccharide deacetylase family protein n=1 Tax=Ectobacillus funiculus TaxID=137993 RepID=UPI00196AF577|nr:polysaccharide deacetylase family protein [Ectobacillus funiculus]